MHAYSDAKNMAKDIKTVLVEVLSRYLQTKPGKFNLQRRTLPTSTSLVSTAGCSQDTAAESVLQRLKENSKYLVDAWG